MKFPLGWLREFVALDAPEHEIARRLTVAGLEVESLERVAPEFSGVVVARVLALKKHPNAERLRLCEVDAGPKGRLSVVCGAPNVRAGMTAALALAGAKLGKAPPLEAAVIRGAVSEGMLCSERELGFSGEDGGILALPAGAPLGAPVAACLGLEETVLDVAVMPNRGDCLSILGLARELGALFGAKVRTPRPARLAVERREESGEAGGVAVEMAAADLCPRYAALRMTEVKAGPSPLWMRRRLELCGMRPLNNVIDVTNYVMLELGQPLHAFDLGKIARAAIVVRRAGGDRAFTTLDGAPRQLHPGDLVIADPEKPLAIAGVMGGLGSEVGDSTTAIMLESAHFEPIAVARTARRLGLRSEASYRFERGVDRAGQVAALWRAAELLRKHAGARPEGPVADFEPRPAPARDIALDLRRMAALLGAAIPARQVRRRLVALGATVKKSANGPILTVTPPSYRLDLAEPADLAEEVARLGGLEDIPAALPARLFGYAAPNLEREFFRATREIMLGAGLTELDTLPFAAPADNRKFGGLCGGEPLPVENPLSAALGEMRMSLIPGLIQALRFNLNREAACFHGFETAKVFFRRAGAPAERYTLASLSYGDYVLAEVGKPAVKADFFTLKGVLETYFAALGVAERIAFRGVQSLAAGFLHPGRCAEITLDGEALGLAGELHPREAMEAELAEPCATFELDLEKLIAYGFLPRRTVESPPRFPAVRRDLALTLDLEFPAGTVVRTIREFGPPLLESVEVFDVYEGGSLPPGKKSVALALRYRARDRTLTDEEVNRIHAALVERARVRLGADLRE